MFLAPKPHIGEADLRRGLRWLMADAGFATAVGALNSGVVLVQEMLSGARRSIRNQSPVAGLQQLAAAFPGGQLLEAHARLKQQRRAQRARLKREEKLVA